MPAASTSTSTSSASAAAVPYVPTYRERPVPIRRSARACAYCRKSKARCDGPELWPCRRCRESCVDCVFEGVPASELGTKNLGGAGPDGLPVRPGSPFSMERRLQVLEQELTQLKRTTSEHSARFRIMDPAGTMGSLQTTPMATPGLFGHGHEMESAHISLDDPAIDELGRAAFDTFWTSMAPWAPYIDPVTDTYQLLRIRSPLLLFCILAITSRFHSNANFTQYCEQQALKHMRNTLYSETLPTLDDLKGTVLYNGWLSRGAPPGHSLTLAAQLELPRTLEKLLSSINKPQNEATKAFDDLMPSVRTWLSLYAQDLWLSVATGRRSMVTIDFSITSARSLLKFGALRPVDARMVAQCELVTILGGVQESFVKTQQHSIAETVKIVQRADEHLDFWMKTWAEWARKLLDSSTHSALELTLVPSHRSARRVDGKLHDFLLCHAAACRTFLYQHARIARHHLAGGRPIGTDSRHQVSHLRLPSREHR
ncbi:hypothetical protein BCR35DRAFT_70699 [Leucosporidium creatinivorum]|uniref:Zn(2)-C6 fungal-type domain-containing protein n=1 Tax=Leucosporidium creatinivorum TaxID=106004 RepID=A0A1Y2G2J0_9BASI|nr:hypothetical protein BCR35DRAFT_70699 [Leucosporidium creatinivorum]